VGRGDGAKWLDAKQETYQDEVSVTGKPMVYVHDQSQEQTDPEQEGADREITGLDREITGPDQTNKDSNQELLTHSTVDGTRNDDVNTVLIE
uniref:Uncharacterized protein n=1 Tax=Plectus sambesii TaxID=2011161 RepID=A0A914X113_9BILA